MRVNLGSLDVDDALRRAINARHGRPGLATRADVRALCLGMLRADLETVQDDFDQHEPSTGDADEGA